MEYELWPCLIVLEIRFPVSISVIEAFQNAENDVNSLSKPASKH